MKLSVKKLVLAVLAIALAGLGYAVLQVAANSTTDDYNFTTITGTACFKSCKDRVLELDKSPELDVLVITSGDHPLGVVRVYEGKSVDASFSLHEDGRFLFSCYGKKITLSCDAFLTQVLTGLSGT